MTTPAEVVKQNAQVVDNTGSKTSPPAQGQPCGKASVEESKRSSATNNPPGGSATLKVMARFRSKPWKLWSGYFALVGRNLPFTGLQFPIFEFVRGRVAERRQKQRQSRESSTDGNGDRRWGAVLERAGLTGFSAAVSATIASLVTSPLDVVKTRVMLSAGDGSVTAGGRELGGQSGRKRPGMFAVGREVFYGEGVRGLFRGAAIRSGWTVVSLSIYLSIYEGSRFYLENRRKEKNGVVDMEAR